MPEQRPSRSAKATAMANLTTRTTHGYRRIRDETSNDPSRHKDIEFDPRKMHDGLRKEFQSLADNYQSDVINPVSTANKDELTALNRQMKKSIHPAVPKALVGQGDWSRQDEKNILAQWEAEKAHWINIYDPDRYLNLWKICLQFAKCTPWDIVGFNTKLSFELSGRAGSGEEDENHTWSAPFIDRLTWLIPHTAWTAVGDSSRSALLATAIQYAVILRTNDQRVWRLSHLGGEFFSAFHTLCRENCPCSIAGIHAQVLARMKEEGIKTISPISRVFQSLENVILTPTESFVPPDEEPYFVTTQDLTNLIKALDRMVDPSTKIRMFLPVRFVYESAKSARGGRQPPNMEQLHEYHKLALIEEMRRKVKAARQTQSIRGPDDGNDDDPFAHESSPVPIRPTKRRRLSHVQTTSGMSDSPTAELGSESRPMPIQSPSPELDFGADLGDGFGPNDDHTPEPVDDDAMSLDSIEEDYGLGATTEQPMAPHKISSIYKQFRVGQRGQAYTIHMSKLR
ncbi:hypothetical protein J3459_011965 [Metarhizium acridum]|nr:hypothetical protein J3459_011965 [Metarhizium acridum]